MHQKNQKGKDKLNRSTSLSDISNSDPNNSSSLVRSLSLTSVNADSEVEDMQVKENWRGKAGKSPPIKSILKRSRRSILNLSPCFKTAPVLLNGFRKIGEKGHITITSNTCAFDSLFSVFAAAYLNSLSIKQTFDRADSVFIKFIKDACSLSVEKEKVYTDRTTIIRNILTSHKYKNAIKIDENVTSVNCMTGLSSFFAKISDKNESVCSIEVNKNCQVCKYDKTYSLPFLPTDLSMIKLETIENSIITPSSISHCEMCRNNILNSFNFSDLLVLDVEMDKSKLKFIRITDITKTICVQNTEFDIFAVIEYVEKSHHFVAHVNEGSGLWQSYDDLDTNVQRNLRNSKKYMFVFMVFYLRKDDAINENSQKKIKLEM